MNDHSPYREDEYQSTVEERHAELFASALARLDDGEAIDEIIASFGAEVDSAELDQVRLELRSMLQLGEFMLAMQKEPVPARPAQRATARRNEFLNQVALERTRQELESPVANPNRAQAGGAARAPLGVTTRSIASAGWWQRLQQALTLGKLRLAPIAATIVIVFTSVFGLWRVSLASLPGDLVYPIKAWMQMMNLSMASPETMGTVANQVSATVQADIAETARRAEANATKEGSLANAVHQESVFLVFEGFDGKLLKFGDIRVVPSWQPDADSSLTTPMRVEGNLQPGAQVWLTMQILPGQADVVQGVRAQVQESAVAAPEPTPIVCVPQRPAGWTNYTVQRGDTIAALATTTSAPVRAIAGANCLESDVLIAGQLLYIPNMAQAPFVPILPAGD